MDVSTALLDLEQKGYFIWDDFLTPAEVRAVILDYNAIFNQGDFKKANTGKQPIHVHSAQMQVRSDSTYWLDPSHLTMDQNLFCARLEQLKNQINEKLFLGLWNLEGHYSFYPIDGFYQKHIDQFSTDDARIISMVLYFNPGWIEGDGGELRINDAMNVTPIGGRLICFLSGKIPHEVLLTHKPRLSFAGWWKRRA